MIAPADRAPQSTPIESVPVETTGNVQGLKSIVTDEKGFAKAGPFTPGGSFPVKETQEDFDMGFLNPIFPIVMLKDAPSA
jgi:hypothetical protein